MHPGLLDVFHDPGDKDLAFAVAHGVDVDLDGVLQEAVDKHGTLGRDTALPARAPVVIACITRRTPSSS